MPLLSIDIEARYAKFQDAMTAMEHTARKSATNIGQAFQSVSGTLAGLGVGLSAAGLVAIVKNAIDAADHLNDLSKKTGVAVEALGGIGFAAQQAGTDLDGAAKALGKLNLSIADAAAGGKDTAEAFRVLGINLKDTNGQLKTADKVLVEIAGKFEQYKDGPNKAAIANQLFGKSYADMIPLLDDGAKSLKDNLDYFARYAKVNSDVAQKADAFNDTLEKIKLLSGSAGNQIAAELLPTLQTLAEKMLEVKEKGDGFGFIGKSIATAIQAVSALGAEVNFVKNQVGNEIGGIAAQLNALAHLDFKSFRQIGELMKADAKAARTDIDKLTESLLHPTLKVDEPTTPASGKPKEDAPALNGKANAELLSKQLQDQMRLLERGSERERQILAARNDMLQTYYQQDLISINAYYDARQAAANEALREQQRNIDKEIAGVRKLTPKDDKVAQAGAEAKIKELQDKRAQLEAANNTESTKGLVERAARAKAFEQDLTGINAQLLEMQGYLSNVAGQRFDTDHTSIRNRIAAEREDAQAAGDTDKVGRLDKAVQELDALRAASVAQGRLNELQIEASRIQSDLQIATERVDSAVQAGTIGELEGLRQVGEARKQAAADLMNMADAFKVAAQSAVDPRFAQMAKEFEAAAKKMADSANLMRDRFQDVFQHGFEGLFDRLLSGTVSLKDALRSTIAEIASDLSKLAIKDLGKNIFSEGGSLGGLVGSVAGFFGFRGGVASSASYANFDWLASAKGNVFNAGNVVPFAKGGMPDVISAPTYFPMKAGRTGLMGEAGPEAIMPLHRDEAGRLAVKMVSDRGAIGFLPLTRDRSGKLSVHAPGGALEKFANGSAFAGGFKTNATGLALSPNARAISALPALDSAIVRNSDERTMVQNVTINVPSGTQRESAEQIAARTVQAMSRASRRNN